MIINSIDRFNGLVASLAVKAPCVVETNSNITLSGEQTVNGVAVVSGDRVLVKDQTNAIENGIWVANTSAWSRSPDFDGNRDVVQGSLVVVSRAGSGGSLTYQVTSNNPITIGTTEIYFGAAEDNPGDVTRFGAIADSAIGVQGTDNAAAFQAAIDSGYAVYVPPGHYSVEGTLKIFEDANGPKSFSAFAGVRLERFTNVSTPILHVSGSRHKIAGGGMILAARNFGGIDTGLFLLGPGPNITASSDESCIATRSNWIEDIYILGKTSNTGWDGSVGFYGESAGRKRGEFITPTTYPTYYNMIRGVFVSQFDYGFFGSTDFNANAFNECGVTSFGHSAVQFNGYANQGEFLIEKGEAQDTTERFTYNFGNKDTGPESAVIKCDYDATEYSITAITKGATTEVTIGTHTVTATDKIRITGINDSGAGDLEALLNDGHFEVISITATTVVISVDTSGAAATWSSGGILADSIYPLLGARANQVSGFVETAFNGSTLNIRLVGCETPVGSYDASNIEGVYGRNVVRVSGTFPGGIGPSGFSTRSSLLNNIVDVTSVGLTDYGRAARLQDFTVEKCDDGSGSGWGGSHFRTYEGVMTGALESTVYDVITFDNVGGTNGSVLIKLTYLAREEANSDHEGGEISWLCPVTASTARAAIKYKDFQGNYNGANQPYVNWSIAESAGGAANTGKFILTATTEAVAGTADFDISWKVEVMAAYGASLDFANDVTIQNGGL